MRATTLVCFNQTRFNSIPLDLCRQSLRSQVNTSYFLLSPICTLYIVMIILQWCCMCVCVCVFFSVISLPHIVPRCNHHYWKRYFECIQFGDHGAKQWHGYWNKWLHSSFKMCAFCCCYYYFESCDMIHNVLRFMAIRKESFTVYPYRNHQRFVWSIKWCSAHCIFFSLRLLLLS